MMPGIEMLTCPSSFINYTRWSGVPLKRLILSQSACQSDNRISGKRSPGTCLMERLLQSPRPNSVIMVANVQALKQIALAAWSPLAPSISLGVQHGLLREFGCLSVWLSGAYNKGQATGPRGKCKHYSTIPSFTYCESYLGYWAVFMRLVAVILSYNSRYWIALL